MAHAEIWFPHDQFSVKWATISPWVMWKSDFHMGHVEIWFLVISAIGDFTNFLKMYGNLSMAITYTNSYRNSKLFFGQFFDNFLGTLDTFQSWLSSASFRIKLAFILLERKLAKGLLYYFFAYDLVLGSQVYVFILT